MKVSCCIFNHTVPFFSLLSKERGKVEQPVHPRTLSPLKFQRYSVALHLRPFHSFVSDFGFRFHGRVLEGSSAILMKLEGFYLEDFYRVFYELRSEDKAGGQRTLGRAEWCDLADMRTDHFRSRTSSSGQLPYNLWPLPHTNSTHTWSQTTS